MYEREPVSSVLFCSGYSYYSTMRLHKFSLTHTHTDSQTHTHTHTYTRTHTHTHTQTHTHSTLTNNRKIKMHKTEQTKKSHKIVYLHMLYMHKYNCESGAIYKGLTIV